MNHTELNSLITNKKAKIGIIGLGYVGLPLALAFLKNKFKIIGFDLDIKKIALLKKGKSYIKHLQSHHSLDLISSKNFLPTSDFKMLNSVDIIIICVPTPLNKFREPDLSYITNTGKSISNYLRKGQLVVLESSTFPGTTKEILSPELEKSGLKANRDFYVAYSPEREDPGNKDFSTNTIPKIVGADTKESLKLVKNLYQHIIDKVHSVSSSSAAEATKLTENIFRSINIALVNELKLIYDEMGVDIWEVIEAAKTKPFGYMPFYPGPGLGGHCIPIDPFYLTFKAREYGIQTKFIELAGEINSSMPSYVVSKLRQALSNKFKKALNGSKILIIGLSYKIDIDDLRESPALEIINQLIDLKSKVDFHDNYFKSIPNTRNYGHLINKKSVNLTPANLKKYDAVVIVTNHSYIDYASLNKHAKLIIDSRNALGYSNERKKIVKA